MKPHQVYFHRNRGQWDWETDFKILSWLGLWRSSTPFLSKVRISALVIVQLAFGRLRMWTNVSWEPNTRSVGHSTKILKWGITLYRSEKIFTLDEDGFGIRLQGFEYYWPIAFVGIPFPPMSGAVDGSTTRGTYQMPIAGTSCFCRVFMELPIGHMDVETPWLRARFSLTDGSNKILASRFEESV